MGRLLKSVVSLTKRQEKLEKDFESKKQELDTAIKDFASTFIEEARTTSEKMNNLDKSVEDIKKELVIIKQDHKSELKKLSDEVKDIKKDQEEKNNDKQIEELTQAFLKDTAWSDIVKKEVDNKIENVSVELSSIQKMVDATKGLVEEERDKEARSKNILLYNLPESSDSSYEERQNHDKSHVLNILRELIDKEFQESEIQKFFRLGKMDNGKNKTRPVLVQFVDKMTKNYLMNNLYNIRKTSFKDLVITHDMTIKERDQCKKLVEEAKLKEQTETSGEWKFRVRGPPGQMRVVKLKNKK